MAREKKGPRCVRGLGHGGACQPGRTSAYEDSERCNYRGAPKTEAGPAAPSASRRRAEARAERARTEGDYKCLPHGELFCEKCEPKGKPPTPTEKIAQARRAELVKQGERMTIRDLAALCHGMGVQLHFAVIPKAAPL